MNRKMNILFLTLVDINSLDEKGIYPDLLRKFINENHKVYIVKPLERRKKGKTHYIDNNGTHILHVNTFNILKTNIIEKGIATLSIEYQFLYAIQRYLSNIKFDAILYSTPPITFTKVIKYIRNKDNALSYLLLKDIFPQNAVDINMISKKGLLYKFFRKKERNLYKLSDFIGCMSPANMRYLLKHNPEIDSDRVEICPNSVEISTKNSLIEKEIIRNKFGIPTDSVVFIYGGNLGKPQGLDFLLKVLDSNQNKKDRFFIIVGSGTEYGKIRQWFEENKPVNSQLLSILPKKEYDELVQSCDVGLILLDPRFTIPNYPSRLLTYMEYQMPVLMATDINTDIGTIAEMNGYGLWCENGDLDKFNLMADKLTYDSGLRTLMGIKGYQFLKENYTVEQGYKIIMKHFE